MDDEEYTWGWFETTPTVRAHVNETDCTSFCETLGGDFTFGWFETKPQLGHNEPPADDTDS